VHTQSFLPLFFYPAVIRRRPASSTTAVGTKTSFTTVTVTGVTLAAGSVRSRANDGYSVLTTAAAAAAAADHSRGVRIVKTPA